MNRLEQALKDAKERGHKLVNDPPAFSRMERHTCSKCGRAVLGDGIGPSYGSALEEICPK